MSEEKKPPQEEPKKSGIQILQEELLNSATGHGSGHPSKGRRNLQALLIPVLAIFTGLVLGGLIIVLTSTEFYTAWAKSPLQALKDGWNIIASSYSALFTGAFGSPAKIVAALQSGNAENIRKAFYPFFESLVASTPYIFGGLAVALGFRAGLFNIGAEGQIFVGAIFGAFVGYSVKGVPAILHVPLAFLAGAIGGGLWGFIPGWQKPEVMKSSTR
jgi:ABC-type uncharacterized transport system permease subunit